MDFEQFRGAGHDDDTFVVVRLALLQSQHFRFGVEMRRQPSHDFNGANAVRDLHHFLRIEVVLLRPTSPLASDRTGGVHQNAVEIEENGCAVECFHEVSLRTLRLALRPLRLKALRTTAKDAKNSAKDAKENLCPVQDGNAFGASDTTISFPVAICARISMWRLRKCERARSPQARTK